MWPLVFPSVQWEENLSTGVGTIFPPGPTGARGTSALKSQEWKESSWSRAAQMGTVGAHSPAPLRAHSPRGKGGPGLSPHHHAK